MNERSSSASALRLTAEAGSWERGDPIARHGLGPGLRRADIGREVGLNEALDSYVADVLPNLPEERVVGATTEGAA